MAGRLPGTRHHGRPPSALVSARALGRRANAAELLYGALITAGSLAVTSTADDRPVRVALGVFGVLVIYWSAHVYSRVMADRMKDPSASARALLAEAAGHEAAVLHGGVPSLAVFVAASALGADVSSAAYIALWATVVMLGLAGWVIGRRAHAHGLELALEVAAAAGFGMLTIALKASLH